MLGYLYVGCSSDTRVVVVVNSSAVFFATFAPPSSPNKDRLVFILVYKRSLYFRPERYDINQGSICLSVSVCLSGCKCKSCLVFILLYKRSLHFRPERGMILIRDLSIYLYIYVSICPYGRKYKWRLVFIFMYKRSLYFRLERCDTNLGYVDLSICL